MEQIYNYRNMTPMQRELALTSLSSIGFCPAYGKIKTMQRAMEKSVGEKMPQFYFVFKDEELTGYMFLIGDDKKFRAFPWLAIDNLDELPMQIVEPLAAIAINAWNNEEGSLIGADGSVTPKSLIAETYKRRLEDFRKGVGLRNIKNHEP